MELVIPKTEAHEKFGWAVLIIKITIPPVVTRNKMETERSSIDAKMEAMI